MVVSYISEAAQRLEANQYLIFSQEKPHDNVVSLSNEKNVELAESSNPGQQIKKIHERFNADKYYVIIKGLEDMRATMMDVM